jgi:nucleoside-diphosphate-sugar epimerase
MRVLVTGAAGFIGAAVAAELHERSHEVACLVRRPGQAEAGLAWAKRAKVIAGDLDHPAGWADELKDWQPEACVHTAWLTDPATYLDSPANVWLLDASLRLVDLLGSAGCRRAVFLGTCAEYDTSAARPLDEAAPLRPATLYASCKVALSLLGARRAEAAGMGFAWARSFHPYGPRENRDRLVPAAIRTLLQGRVFASSHPEARRDLVHVEDVAAGLASLVEASAEGTFNLSTGRPISVREVLDLLGEITGRPDLLSFGAPPRQGWDPESISGPPDRIRAATGWQPRIALRDGLASAYAWWSEQKEPVRSPGGA